MCHSDHVLFDVIPHLFVGNIYGIYTYIHIYNYCILRSHFFKNIFY